MAVFLSPKLHSSISSVCVIPARATMRSREISVSIIIQNLAQLKALFEKQWESIVSRPAIPG